jgi:hypothetical protein
MTILEEDSEAITKKLYAKLIPSGVLPITFLGFSEMNPMPFFSIALPHAINDQFIGQVKKFLIHGAIFSHTGHLCNISLEQAQMEVGILWKQALRIMDFVDILLDQNTLGTDRNYTAMHTHVRRSVHLSALLIT